MLEALIKTRPPGSPCAKAQGDVIVVKLAGSPWGDKELKVHQLVAWEDAALEATLTAQVSKETPYPIAVNPYAVRNRDGEVVQRSSEFVDINALPADLKGQIRDPNVRVEKLEKTAYQRATRMAPKARAEGR